MDETEGTLISVNSANVSNASSKAGVDFDNKSTGNFGSSTKGDKGTAKRSSLNS